MQIYSREVKVKITISIQFLKIILKEKIDKTKSDTRCKNVKIIAVFPCVTISEIFKVHFKLLINFIYFPCTNSNSTSHYSLDFQNFI